MQIYRLEATNSDPSAGGILAVFPSNKRKQATWRHPNSQVDPMLLAKDIAARLLDNCLQEGRSDDADRTNWPSVVAAVRKHILDWQARYRAHELARTQVIVH